MTDSEHSGRWLPDGSFVLHTGLLVAASALAVVLTSCLWYHIYPDTPTHTSQQSLSLSVPISDQDQGDRKSTRSKERRRRGKDPFRELLKGGKKSKALLKSIRVTTDHEHSSLSADTLSNGSMPSRSQSPEPARDASDVDAEETKDTISTDDTSAAVSSGDLSDACSTSHSHCIAPTETEVNASCASTAMGHVPELASSSPPESAPSDDVSTPPPRESSCAKLVRIRTRLRASKLADSVAGCAPCPTLSISTSRSTDGAGPSTPTNSTPPRSQSPSEGEQPLQIQLASMRGALEAARLREEKLRVEAEQASKERDEFCWRWNEDAGVWRRREAELQAHIHHLVQQLQAYAAVASFQAMNAPSPTSPQFHGPFPIQSQNSASAPAHVQALLTSHPPGFGPAGYPGVSPLLWSGMGLCVPNRDPRHGGRRTPDSSGSGSSPSRGRRRRAASNESSSMGEWDGSEEEGCEEEEEFRNNALADAILKRPESIRGLGGRKRTGVQDALQSPAPSAVTQ